MNRLPPQFQDQVNLPSLPEDPRLQALLDEVLMPAPPSANLADRIFAATASRLPQPSSSILARLGQYAWVRSMAASIVVAASAGIVLTVGSIFQNAHNWVSLQSDFRDTLSSLSLISNVPTPPATNPLVKLDTANLSRDLEAMQAALDQALHTIEPLNTTSDNSQL